MRVKNLNEKRVTPMTREATLETALNRLYVNVLDTFDGDIHRVPGRKVRDALIHAAHVMDYHGMCGVICTERAVASEIAWHADKTCCR